MKTKLVVLAAALLLAIGFQVAQSQLAPSGNAVQVSAALPTGSNVIGGVTQSGTWNVGTVASITAALPTGSNVIGAVTQSGTWSIAGSPYTNCGATKFNVALVAVPTSPTAATATTTCLMSISFNNTTAGPLTITVTDGQGTPVALVSSFSLPAYSTVGWSWPNGVQMTTGVKWSASAAGVTGGMFGVQ
jgi:hypothetical protein